MNETRQRAKEICFLEIYFYPWIDCYIGKVDISNRRRIAMAFATLTGCSAKAVEEMLQLRDISTKEKEDIVWKTEHNIYPHKVTWWERIHYLINGRIPNNATFVRRRLGGYTNTVDWRRCIENTPKLYGKDYNSGPILHEEHWDAMERIMLFFASFLEFMPMYGAWQFENGYEMFKCPEAFNPDKRGKRKSTEGVFEALAEKYEKKTNKNYYPCNRSWKFPKEQQNTIDQIKEAIEDGYSEQTE